MLKIGDKAPDFTGIDQNGNPISLKDFRGRKVVLYFYPKANTPGCTAEACSLNDNLEHLKTKGYEIIGVSADNVKAQKNFAEKYHLNFPLIADTEKNIIKSYGAWGKKKRYGKEYEGIMRYTFLISEDGLIQNIITQVDTKNHASQILEKDL
ncbi:MAG TPA: thioredoxin-dependent thiol peroxidase [Bacteroidales bacterium]|jgi:peroxiredoxin Q/BCP|nr:thioredoxin-dependent thiol peroxidase [Bacteroidales bacterium]